MFEDLEQVLQDIVAEINHNNDSSWYSWTYCYGFFQNTVFQTNPITDHMRDYACLHLAFYLASWGMFRGSSHLRNKTFTFFRPIVDILCDNQYTSLRNGQFPNGFENNNGYVELVKGLYNRISNQILQRVHGWEPTDTLITKILLGTMACVPAYDKFFKKGLDVCEIHPHSSFSSKSFDSLIDAIRHNNLSQHIENIHQNNVQLAGLIQGWPLMKIVDAYFWVKGR